MEQRPDLAHQVVVEDVDPAVVVVILRVGAHGRDRRPRCRCRPRRRSRPTSSNVPFPWLMNRKFGSVSLAMNTSIQPSSLKSAMGCPSPCRGTFRSRTFRSRPRTSRCQGCDRGGAARSIAPRIAVVFVAVPRAAPVRLAASRTCSSRRRGRVGRRCRSRTRRRRRSGYPAACCRVPDASVTSVNVPSPLLWYSVFSAGVGEEEISVAIVVVVADRDAVVVVQVLRRSSRPWR